MTRRIIVVMLSLVALAALACSREPRAYSDLSSLGEAVTASGVPCDRIDPGPQAQLVSETGTCAASGVTLYRFDRVQDLDDWKKVGTLLGPALIGPNWTATGRAEDLGRISDELGGEVLGTT